MQSSDATGVCYVETANLDGETNLKVKASAGVGVESGEDADAREVFEKLRDARVECEAPNNQLYKFEGKLVGVAAGVTEKVDAAATAGIEPAANDDDDDDDDASKDAVAPADVRRADGFSPTFFPREIPLGVDNVLLRGSTLRNTTWILGVVVFTGKDSKLMKNMTRAPHKVSQLERHMNLLVASIGLFQIVISATLAGTQQRWFKDEMEPKTHAGDAFRHWYLASTNEWPDVEGGVGAAFTQFIRYVVLLNALIPISLYVTLELVKVIQCGWIRCDRKLYDPIYDVRCGCDRAFDLPSRSHPSRLSPPVESSAWRSAGVASRCAGQSP
jgi:phospholipid-translocating ATPase/phospholipid-transporting ATPase